MTEVMELPALDVSLALSNPRGFFALATGDKLDEDVQSQMIAIAREGYAMEQAGTAAQAVSAFVWTSSKTGTAREWCEAVGISVSAGRVSQLTAAGKALVTLDLPEGISPTDVVSAAGNASKAIREAKSKTALRKAVQAAKADKKRTPRPNPGTLTITPEEADALNGGNTPEVTEGKPGESKPDARQRYITALVDACQYLSDEAASISEADALTITGAVTALVDALSTASAERKSNRAVRAS